MFKINFKNIALLTVFVICLVLIIVILINNSGIFDTISEKLAGEDEGKASDYYNAIKDVTIDGNKYRPRKNITTYLLIGEDKDGEIVQTYGNRNDSQADFLAYLVVDDNTKSYEVIHINRDTWTNIDVLGFGGGKIETIQAQIALSHTYGDGVNLSCQNTAKSVSSLFFGLPVNHYVSLRLNAISILTDYVGGVTIKMPSDYTDIDESYTEGALITLNGSQAVKFIQAREDVGDETNVSRMERQRLFIDAFVENLLKHDTNTDSLTEAIDRLAPYMVSKFSVNDISLLFDKVKKYTNNGITVIDGSLDFDENGYQKFNPSADSLKQIAFRLLCDKIG